MNHNDFFKLIAADGLRGAYLLQGEEEFVKASALKAAEKLIPEDFRAFNMSVLYEPDADALTEACETLPLSDIIKWCMKTANKQGAALDSDTARTFAGLVGTDMTAISNELQKLIDTVGPGGTITRDTISRCTVGSIEFQVFAMIDCFTAGKVRDGMRALHGLLEDRDAALGIASFLESRFKLMLEGRKLMDGGLSAQTAAAKLEGNRYANTKACTAAKKYSSAKLAELVGNLANVGYGVVSGGAAAVDALEKIMAGFEW